MKRILILLFILLLSLSSCKHEEEKTPEEKIDQIIENIIEDNDKENDQSKEQKNNEPEDNKSEEQQENQESSDIDNNQEEEEKPQYDYEDCNSIIQLFLEKYYALDYLNITCEGTTTAKAVITYTQIIKNIIILDGANSYYLADSTSGIEQYHEAKFNIFNVSYKNKEKDDFTETTLSNYIDIYGITPYTKGVVGYDLTKGNILDISLVQSKDNIYAYQIKIDPNYDFVEIKKQMKEFGELKDYPTFDSITMTIIMDNELNPIKVILESKYHINKSFILNNVECNQSLTYTYSKRNN